MFAKLTKNCFCSIEYNSFFYQLKLKALYMFPLFSVFYNSLSLYSKVVCARVSAQFGMIARRERGQKNFH